MLSKDESASNLEQAENLLKRHEGLLTTMDANDEKVTFLIIMLYREVPCAPPLTMNLLNLCCITRSSSFHISVTLSYLT